MLLIPPIEQISVAERKELIAKHIAPDLHHPGIAHYRLRDAYISVWALVAYYQTVRQDYRRVARDYDVSEEHVRAALAFYLAHSDAVDAYLSATEARSMLGH